MLPLLPALTPPLLPVSLSAPTFVPPAVLMFEALPLSVSDPMLVTIPEFPASLTVPLFVKFLEPQPAFSIVPPSISPFTPIPLLQFPSSAQILVSSRTSQLIAPILESSRTFPPTVPTLVRVNDEKLFLPVKLFIYSLPQLQSSVVPLPLPQSSAVSNPLSQSSAAPLPSSVERCPPAVVTAERCPLVVVTAERCPTDVV